MSTETQIDSGQADGLSITCEFNEDRAVMHMKGRLEFFSHRSIREGVKNILAHKELKLLTINLAMVEYISSSGIGMLLVIRDMATAARIKLCLINPVAQVENILDIVHLDRLIPITHGSEKLHSMVD